MVFCESSEIGWPYWSLTRIVLETCAPAAATLFFSANSSVFTARCDLTAIVSVSDVNGFSELSFMLPLSNVTLISFPDIALTGSFHAIPIASTGSFSLHAL